MATTDNTTTTDASFAWGITDLQVYPSYDQNGVSLSNVVVKVLWTYTCTYQGVSGSTNGSCDLDLPDPSSTDFIPFNQLTQEQILSWVQSKIGGQEPFFQTFTLNLCKAQLQQQPVSMGLPWASSV